MNSLQSPNLSSNGAASPIRPPGFPARMLPEAFRGFVEGEAAASQTPLGLVATLALGVCSAAIGGKVSIAARPGFTQPSNLFVAAITDGTNREASLFARIRRPLEMIEAGRIKASRSVQAEEKSRLRQAHLRLRELEREFARPQAFALAKEIADNPLPAVPRLIVDDTTTVRIDTVLAEQQGHIARFAGEVAVRELFAGSAAKSNLARHEVYRKAYRGENITVDLRGGVRVPLKQTAITCACAIPRSAIEGLHKRRGQGRGVTDCFLLAMPESSLGRRQIAPPPLPKEVSEKYSTLVQGLETIEGHVTLRLSDEARQSLEAWEAEVETMLADGGLLSALPTWGDNLPGNTLRIAAVLHCIRQHEAGNSPDELVTRETIDAAISIAWYFLAHTVAAFQLMRSPANKTSTASARSEKTSSGQTNAQATQPASNPPPNVTLPAEKEPQAERLPTAPTQPAAPPKFAEATVSSSAMSPPTIAIPLPPPQQPITRSANPGQHHHPPDLPPNHEPTRQGRPPRKFRGKPVGSGKAKH